MKASHALALILALLLGACGGGGGGSTAPGGTTTPPPAPSGPVYKMFVSANSDTVMAFTDLVPQASGATFGTVVQNKIQGAIAFDSQRDKLYAASYGDNTGQKVAVFDNASTMKPGAPISRKIMFANLTDEERRSSSIWAMVSDRERDRLYVVVTLYFVDYIYIFNNASTLNGLVTATKIHKFRMGVHKALAVDTKRLVLYTVDDIGGGTGNLHATQLDEALNVVRQGSLKSATFSSANGVAVDAERDRVFVSQGYAFSLLAVLDNASRVAANVAGAQPMVDDSYGLKLSIGNGAATTRQMGYLSYDQKQGRMYGTWGNEVFVMEGMPSVKPFTTVAATRIIGPEGANVQHLTFQ